MNRLLLAGQVSCVLGKVTPHRLTPMGTARFFTIPHHTKKDLAVWASHRPWVFWRQVHSRRRMVRSARRRPRESGGAGHIGAAQHPLSARMALGTTRQRTHSTWNVQPASSPRLWGMRASCNWRENDGGAHVTTCRWDGRIGQIW